MIRITERLINPRDVETNPSWGAPLSAAISGSIKRAFDIIAAFLGLLFLLPFFSIIAILIKRDSPGPVFYWGPRIGKRGVIFQMLKFRTMYEAPKSYLGPRVTCEDDERVTPLGKWLRDTKLNELPQLVNVLKGDMSLVGPRPEDPTIAKTWPTKIAREILSVRPGITSPASVIYRDEENMLQAGNVMQKYLHELSPDKMRLDQLYIRYRSFWLDLDVIFWTMMLLIPKIKTYTPPEHLLFVGPMTRLMKRYVGWFLGDFLIVAAAIIFTGVLIRLSGPLHIGWGNSALMALGCSLFYSLVGYCLNTNRINWSKASMWEASRIIGSWAISTIAIFGIHHYLEITSLRIYGLMIGSSILSLFGMIVIRYRGRLASGISTRLPRQWNTRQVRERVLVVGSGRTAEHIAWLMEHPTYSRKFQIVGFMDDDLMTQGMSIYGARVIGRVENIQEIVRERDIGLIILADNQIASRQFRDFQDTSRFSPARIVVAPDIFGSLSGLDGGIAQPEAEDNPNDFQCLHCMARHANHPIQFQNIRAYELEEASLMRKSPE